MTGSNMYFLLSRRLFEGKQRSRRAHTRIAGLRLALTCRSTPFFLGRTRNQCNSQPWELNFTWQAEGSVSSLSSASSAKPQSRCALETRCRSSTDTDPAVSPVAHQHLITADHSALMATLLPVKYQQHPQSFGSLLAELTACSSRLS